MLNWRLHPHLLTPAEMGQADRAAVAAGTASIDLMERAGAAVAREAARMARSGGRVLVVCGPGNNGGDGFVAARVLRGWNYRVEIALLGEAAALKGDAGEAARRWGGAIAPLADADFGRADFILDALFGAGLDRDVAGEALACIEAMNASGRPILSVDVPSGLDGASGAARPIAARADATVTLGFSNKTPYAHAMRLHGHCMRLLHPKDDGWEPYWRDTVLLGPGQTVHAAFVADNSGKWPLESATPEHQAAGLKTWFEVG